MNAQRLAVGFTALNLALLLAALTLIFTQRHGGTLRVGALELVDGSGQVRAELNTEQDGEVVLRLRDPEGAIRVKLGAGAQGSGLVLLDETTEPGVQILARQQGTAESPGVTGITLKAPDGQQSFTPYGE